MMHGNSNIKHGLVVKEKKKHKCISILYAKLSNTIKCYTSTNVLSIQ